MALIDRLLFSSRSAYDIRLEGINQPGNSPGFLLSLSFVLRFFLYFSIYWRIFWAENNGIVAGGVMALYSRYISSINSYNVEIIDYH